MSAPCPVPGCDLTATEWTVCRSCASRLARELAAIPGLAAQVELTLARQGAAGGHSGPRSPDPALCFDPRASAALGALKAVLVGWVRVLAEDDDPDVVWPADTLAGCSAWLLERVPVLRTHPAGGDVADEVHRAVVACYRTLDRPPPVFAGQCEDCGTALYAHPEASGLHCWACGTAYVAEDRRRALPASARDYTLTIPELGRALLVPAATLRSWRHRGRLFPHGQAEGHDTYLIGDVLDLLDTT